MSLSDRKRGNRSGGHRKRVDSSVAGGGTDSKVVFGGVVTAATNYSKGAHKEQGK